MAKSAISEPEFMGNAMSNPNSLISLALAFLCTIDARTWQSFLQSKA